MALVLQSGAQPIVGCYSMHLYCRYVHSAIELTNFPHEFSGKDEAACNRKARANGWILHRDNYATCPDCAEVLTGKKKPKVRTLEERGFKMVPITEILGK